MENQEHVGPMEEKGEMQEEASSSLQTSPLILHPSFRTCNKCGETKPESEYYRSGSGHLERVCKACKVKRARENEQIRRAKMKTVGANLAFARNAKQTARKTKTDMPSNATGLMEDDGRTQDGRSQGSPLQRQVGGDHYKGFVIQSVEFITRNKLGFLEGCIIKRLCRYNRPGGKGLEDLRKIGHEIELLVELEG